MIRTKGSLKALIPHTFLLFYSMAPCLHAMDNNHFYRACNFWGEPRFEKKQLTSCDATIAGGWSHHGLDNNGHRRLLLDTWGLHSIAHLAQGVPGVAPDDPLQYLGSSTTQKPYGIVSLGGSCQIREVQLSWQHTIAHGIFTHIHLPLRALHIHDICMIDCSPTTYQDPVWDTIKHSFFEHMYAHGICLNPTTTRGIGDTTGLVGWTINYEDTKELDFVDFTIKTGVLFPTGPARDEQHPLSLPLGYNRHWAIPISAAYALGLFEWFTAGVFGDSLFFFDRTATIRLKTAPCQSGLIKLACGETTMKRGPLWDIGGYVKIDHAGNALSLVMGYTYAVQSQTTLYPLDSTRFSYSTVNSDAYYRGWRMHTLHVGAEYDLATETNAIGPRLGIFYNTVLSGQRIFTTGMLGGSLGLDIQWHW